MLSAHDYQMLEEKGIFYRIDMYGTRISITPQGLYLILNFFLLNKNEKLSITRTVLKKLAKLPPKKDEYRELRCQFFKISCHSHVYFLPTFYLNGTPPRTLLSLPPCSSPSDSLEFPAGSRELIKVRNNQIIDIRFAEEELKKLEQGGVVSYR
jgi:hypothetical protein